MKKALVSLLLTALFLFAACGRTSFTVTMTEANGAADSISMMVKIDGTTYSDLTFTIGGIPYTVSDIPTVSDPAFGLTTAQEDGMASVRLIMPPDASDAQLTMLSESGTELVYTCPLEELQPLLDWAASN